MQKTALVTGANGQTGSYLCELLLGKGYRVLGITRRSSTNTSERLYECLNDINFHLIEGDITDPYSVNSWFTNYGQIDECYNLAAMSHVGSSFEQPIVAWRVDAEGVLNVLESIRRYSKHTKFYQASTSEMFGKNFSHGEAEYTIGKIGGFKENERPWVDKYQDENTELSGRSPYAIAKIAAHNAVQLYKDSYGLHASCGILFNHESPRRTDQFVTKKITKWLGKYLDWAEHNSVCTTTETDYLFGNFGSRYPKLRLGNLDSFRDWGFAPDYAQAIYMIVQQEMPDDYVIATGQTHSIREFLTEAFEYAGLGDWSKYVVQDKAFIRPAEVDYLCGRANKAKKVLGWEPKTTFKDLVKIMVDYDKAQAKTSST